MSSHPTSKARRRRQKIKREYARLREDCQLAGIIETLPAGAVRDECVPASAQSEQLFPELIAQAIRKGWAVEEEKKPGLVDELERMVLDPNMPAKAKITALNALRMADQCQYERDHPEKAAQSVATVLNVVEVMVASDGKAIQSSNCRR